MENCVFCGIISGHVPGTKVAEDDLTLTFMDINPAADGHMLVIPKFHSEDLLVYAGAISKDMKRNPFG